MRNLKRFVLALAIVVLVVGAVGWWYSRELATAFLALVSTVATAVMALTIYQLDLSLQHLRFDALNKTYEYLNEDIKTQLDEIAKWAQKGEPVDEVLGNSNKRGTVRYASIALNKVGYFVYKRILDESFVQEEFGGLVVRSFATIRPYLLAMREQSEPADKPWFMRRFFLMVVVACEHFLAASFGDYLDQIVERYADKDGKNDFAKGRSLVRREWLSEDVQSWLNSKGYWRSD